MIFQIHQQSVVDTAMYLQNVLNYARKRYKIFKKMANNQNLTFSKNDSKNCKTVRELGNEIRIP